MKRLLLSALMFADTLAQRDASDVCVSPAPKNAVRTVELNRYGTASCPTEQVIFWTDDDTVLAWHFREYIDGTPGGSPWTFKLHGQRYTVHYEHFVIITSKNDRERDNFAVQPIRAGLTPD